MSSTGKFQKPIICASALMGVSVVLSGCGKDTDCASFHDKASCTRQGCSWWVTTNSTDSGVCQSTQDLPPTNQCPSGFDYDSNKKACVNSVTGCSLGHLLDTSNKCQKSALDHCAVVDSSGQHCSLCEGKFSIDQNGACTITDPSQCASVDPNCASCDLQTKKCLRCNDNYEFDKSGQCVMGSGFPLECSSISCDNSQYCRRWTDSNMFNTSCTTKKWNGEKCDSDANGGVDVSCYSNYCNQDGVCADRLSVAGGDVGAVMKYDALPFFIGSYTVGMGNVLGESGLSCKKLDGDGKPVVQNGKPVMMTCDTLGRGIYCAKLKRDPDGKYSFQQQNSTLVYESPVGDDGSKAFGRSPSFVKAVPERNMLLATNEHWNTGGVQSFWVDFFASTEPLGYEYPYMQAFDTMQPHNSTNHATIAAGTNSPVYIDISNDGKHFGVAEYGGSGSAQHFRFDSPITGSEIYNANYTAIGTESFNQNFTVTDTKAFSPDPKNPTAHVHCFRYVPTSIIGDNACVALVSDLGDNLVRQFDCSAPDGSLTDMKADLPVPAARHIDFHPSANYAVVISEDGEDATSPPKIHSFEYKDNSFSQTAANAVSVLPKGDDWKTKAQEEGSPLYKNMSSAKGSDVHFHPTLENVLYVSTRGYDRIVKFNFDKSNGSLTRVKDWPTSGKTQGSKGYTPRTFEIVPDGSGDKDGFLLIASNQDSHNLVVFKLNPKSGDLELTDAEIHTPFPTSTTAFPLSSSGGGEIN